MQISPQDLWNEDNGNLLAYAHMGHIVTDLLSLSQAKKGWKKNGKKAPAN